MNPDYSRAIHLSDLNKFESNNIENDPGLDHLQHNNFFKTMFKISVNNASSLRGFGVFCYRPCPSFFRAGSEISL